MPVRFRQTSPLRRMPVRSRVAVWIALLLFAFSMSYVCAQGVPRDRGTWPKKDVEAAKKQIKQIYKITDWLIGASLSALQGKPPETSPYDTLKLDKPIAELKKEIAAIPAPEFNVELPSTQLSSDRHPRRDQLRTGLIRLGDAMGEVEYSAGQSGVFDGNRAQLRAAVLSLRALAEGYRLLLAHGAGALDLFQKRFEFGWADIELGYIPAINEAEGALADKQKVWRADVVERAAKVESTLLAMKAILLAEAKEFEVDIAKIEKTKTDLMAWKAKNEILSQQVQAFEGKVNVSRRTVDGLTSSIDKRKTKRSRKVAEQRAAQDDLNRYNKVIATEFHDSPYKCPEGRYFDYCDHKIRKDNYRAWIDNNKYNAGATRNGLSGLQREISEIDSAQAKDQQELTAAKMLLSEQTTKLNKDRETLNSQVAKYNDAFWAGWRWVWESRADAYAKENEQSLEQVAKFEARLRELQP